MRNSTHIAHKLTTPMPPFWVPLRGAWAEGRVRRSLSVILGSFFWMSVSVRLRVRERRNPGQLRGKQPVNKGVMAFHLNRQIGRN